MEERFDFPKQIFEMCEITSLELHETDMYKEKRMKSKFLSISKAELRTLIIGEKRDMPILSNNQRLLDFAEDADIFALDIYDIFKLLFEKEKLSKEDIKNILNDMEEKDNTRFKDKEKIFK